MTTDIEKTKAPVMADADPALAETAQRRQRMDHDHPFYKWVVLSNTTLGMLLAAINASIVLISLPAIFRGIGLNPLAPANVGYLLWMLMGYLVVTAVLVVFFGRLGDMYGRVRIYNLGFVVFTLAAIALSFDPFHLDGGAIWLIAWRVIQGVGGAMLMSSSARHPHRCVPVQSAWYCAGRQHGRRGRRFVPWSAHRRRAVGDPLAGHLLGRRADRYPRYRLELPLAEENSACGLRASSTGRARSRSESV